MRFRVGAETIRVRITEGTLRDSAGRECAGLWIWREHVIYISGTMPRQRRPEIFRHEWRHVMRDLLGVPGNEECECNQFATMTRDLERQFTMQGGDWAMMRMEPEGTKPVDDLRVEELAPAQAYAVKCRCGTMIGMGGVHNGKPRLMDGRPVIDRGCQCPDCAIWICWVEAITPGGAPSGRIVSGPEYRTEMAA